MEHLDPRIDKLFEEIYHTLAPEGDRAPQLRHWLEIAESWYIRHALETTRDNRSSAARALGIGRRTLYTRLDRLGLATCRYRRPGLPGPTPLSHH